MQLSKLRCIFDTNNDWSMAVLRLVVGFVFVFHGWGKITGGGIAGFATGLESMGFPFPTLNAFLAIAAEFGGGLMLMFGLGARAAAIPIIFTMLVAIGMVHGKNGFSMQNSGYEYNVVLIAGALAVLRNGAGMFSLDRLIASKMKQPDSE